MAVEVEGTVLCLHRGVLFQDNWWLSECISARGGGLNEAWSTRSHKASDDAYHHVQVNLNPTWMGSLQFSSINSSIAPFGHRNCWVCKWADVRLSLYSGLMLLLEWLCINSSVWLTAATAVWVSGKLVDGGIQYSSSSSHLLQRRWACVIIRIGWTSAQCFILLHRPFRLTVGSLCAGGRLLGIIHATIQWVACTRSSVGVAVRRTFRCAFQK